MHENEVPIGPMIYFGTFPIPLHQLHLTEEQMRILQGLEPPEVNLTPPKLKSSFPEDYWLEPDEP